MAVMTVMTEECGLAPEFGNDFLGLFAEDSWKKSCVRGGSIPPAGSPREGATVPLHDLGLDPRPSSSTVGLPGIVGLWSWS